MIGITMVINPMSVPDNHLQRQEANPLRERSLLTAQASANWRGFPLGWLEADPCAEVGGSEVQTTCLALLDTGSAQAAFSWGRRSLNCDLSAGSMGLFTRGTRIRSMRWQCQGVRRIIVEVDLLRLADPEFQESVHRLPWETVAEFRDEQLATLLRCMVKEAADGSIHGQLYAESLSMGVALRLAKLATCPVGKDAKPGKLSVLQLRRLDEWIQANLVREISLAEMADVVGYSPAHFVRLFKCAMKCTPYRHVMNLRLDRAREMVVSGQLPMVAIAAETGFGSQSHLTVAFARRFKLPPGQLRREHL